MPHMKRTTKTIGEKSPKVSEGLEPHPVELVEPKKANQPKRGLEAPHISRPVRNCQCDSCREHRKRNRQALRDAALAAMYEHVVAPGGMTVQTGQNATEALRRALGAE